MDVAFISVGLLLIFFGRRLLWLLVAVAGFLMGYLLVGSFLPAADPWIRFAIGIAFGVAFGLLTRGFARFLLGLAGFILIGGLALTLTTPLGLSGGPSGFVIFLIGGLIGIGLVTFAFDLSLTLLSVLGGTALFLEGLPGLVELGNQNLQYLVAIVVAVLGFLAQWQGWRR